jgi:type I restriction enzyme R subunit
VSAFTELNALCPGLVVTETEIQETLAREPLVGLTQFGLFGEHLIRCILAFEALEEQDSTTQPARLNVLSNRGFLPTMLLPFFHVLDRSSREGNAVPESLQMRASLVANLAERLAAWFARSYGPHLPPVAKAAPDADGVMKAVRENPPSDTVRRSARKAAAGRASRMLLSEGETRVVVDFQLRAAGWQVDTLALRHSLGARPEKGANKAIAEWQTETGPADYALFAGLDFIGVVEAKKMGKDVISDVAQGKRYSRGAQLDAQAQFIGGPWGEYRVPFLFSTNARPYLEQLVLSGGSAMP